MKILGMLRSLVPNLFRWGVISRWLIALCFWAISMQLLYPVLSPWPPWGLINTFVVGLCLLVLVTRLAARFSPEKQIWMVIKPILNIADVIALAFITYGVAIYLNAVFGEPLGQPQYAEVIHISEEPTRLGPWWPAGRVQLAMRGSETSERYMFVDDVRLQTLLPGGAVTMQVYQGAFGVPWVDLKAVHPDRQATVTNLVERGIKDPLVTKWAVQNELTGKRFKQALKLAKDYFEQEPEDFYFAMSLADGAVRDGNPALAVQILEPFVSGSPQLQTLPRICIRSGIQSRDDSEPRLHERRSWYGSKRARGVLHAGTRFQKSGSKRRVDGGVYETGSTPTAVFVSAQIDYVTAFLLESDIKILLNHTGQSWPCTGLVASRKVKG